MILPSTSTNVQFGSRRQQRSRRIAAKPAISDSSVPTKQIGLLLYRTLSSKLPELGKLISAARQDRVMPSNALRLASRRRQVDEVEASDTF
jgi:hypothetical protein